MTSNKFKKLWLNRFASGISNENIQKYVVSTGNYIWHIFSWHLLPDGSYLEGEEARQAFDQADKDGAIYMDAFRHKFCRPLPEKLHHAADLDQFTEVYVAAKDFSWTYTKTHESQCGPYFFRKF